MPLTLMIQEFLPGREAPTAEQLDVGEVLVLSFDGEVDPLGDFAAAPKPEEHLLFGEWPQVSVRWQPLVGEDYFALRQSIAIIRLVGTQKKVHLVKRTSSGRVCTTYSRAAETVNV